MLRLMKGKDRYYRCFHVTLEVSKISHTFVDSHLFAVCRFFVFWEDRLAHASMFDLMPCSRIAYAHMMSCDSLVKTCLFSSLSCSAKGA